MKQENKQNNFKKRLKVILGTGAIATSVALTGCNQNQKPYQASIEIQDNKFEKILQKYVKNYSLLQREEYQYIIENMDEISEQIIKGIDSKILETMNKNEAIYTNIEYEKDEEYNYYIKAKKTNGKTDKIKINGERENEIKDTAVDLVKNILQLEEAEKENQKPVSMIMEEDRATMILLSTKDISEIFKYNEIEYEKGEIKLKQLKERNMITEIEREN